MEIKVFGKIVVIGGVRVEFDSEQRAMDFVKGIVLEKAQIPVEVPTFSKYDVMTVEQLDLSVRSYNCLKRAGFNYLGEVRSAGTDKLLSIRNMGTRNVQEIQEKLEEIYGQ